MISFMEILENKIKSNDCKSVDRDSKNNSNKKPELKKKMINNYSQKYLKK